MLYIFIVSFRAAILPLSFYIADWCKGSISGSCPDDSGSIPGSAPKAKCLSSETSMYGGVCSHPCFLCWCSTMVVHLPCKQRVVGLSPTASSIRCVSQIGKALPFHGINCRFKSCTHHHRVIFSVLHSLKTKHTWVGDRVGNCA